MAIGHSCVSHYASAPWLWPVLTPWPILDPERILLPISHLAQFSDELQAGRITASEAVDAFRWKALECQEKFNCVTEFLKEAPDLALALDAEYAGGKQKPPLFGIPFSVKETFFVSNVH